MNTEQQDLMVWTKQQVPEASDPVERSGRRRLSSGRDRKKHKAFRDKRKQRHWGA